MNLNNFLFDKSDDKYTLWLSDVYVWENYRNIGVASQLVEQVNKTAEQMNTKIYLCCDDPMIKYYSNKGWNLIESVDKLYGI